MPMPKIEVIQDDITRITADAIVNAANSDLMAGGGVCGAIFRAAGMNELSIACNGLAPCPTGSAVITPAFAITTAKFIIHAVGPIYHRYAPDEARNLLWSAYASAIEIAAENDCDSVAIPAISTGIYSYPLDDACKVAVSACRATTITSPISIKLVAFDAATANALQKNLAND